MNDQALFTTQKDKDQSLKEEVSVYEATVVLDAGDGAMDAGSSSENRVYEKHMNLSIIKMIGGGLLNKARNSCCIYQRR